MESTEDQDSSDIIFDEVRERPLATPEVGIFPDGPSVHPSLENLNSNSEEEASKVDEIPSTDSENLKQRMKMLQKSKMPILLFLTLMTTYQDSMSFGN